MTHYDSMMQKMTVEGMVSLIAQQSCKWCIWANEDCSHKVCVDGIKKWLTEEEDIKAHWVPCENKYDERSNAYKCSNCGRVHLLRYGTPKEHGYNFCPHCGAKME